MYGYIIEGPLIEKAAIGLNLHESPLPRFRGCNGYSHAILEGEFTYGTSFHLLQAELDSGDLIDQEVFSIDQDETSKELYVRTMYISNHVFKRNIPLVAKMEVDTKHMDKRGEPIRPRSSLMALKLIREEEIGFAQNVYRRVRALDFVPFEPSYFERNGQRFYIFVNNALGRFDHGQSASACCGLESVVELCERESTFVLRGMPREMVVMGANEYCKWYPIFMPEYSWVRQ
jgi:methionyl-tRNA formyltransferase